MSTYKESDCGRCDLLGGGGVGRGALALATPASGGAQTVAQAAAASASRVRGRVRDLRMPPLHDFHPGEAEIAAASIVAQQNPIINQTPVML